MPSAFLDSGYLVSLMLERDQYHASAVRYWRNVSRDDVDIVTTSLVLVEAVTFLNARGYHSRAVSIGNMLMNRLGTRMIHVDESLLMDGWDYFQRHTDKIYSLTDCVSFVVMEKYDVYTAYAFDRDFIQAGFMIEPMRS